MRRVLTEPSNALVRQYHAMFARNQAAFHITRGALAGIAGIARSKGTGARGLRSILEELLQAAMVAGGSSTLNPVGIWLGGRGWSVKADRIGLPCVSWLYHSLTHVSSARCRFRVAGRAPACRLMR